MPLVLLASADAIQIRRNQDPVLLLHLWLINMKGIRSLSLLENQHID